MARSLQKAHRRQDRRAVNKQRALDIMRNGAVFRRTFVLGKPHWTLSGLPVPHETATDLLRDPFVIPVGDALFGDGSMSQTFRYAE
jgi:hypothetical protein